MRLFLSEDIWRNKRGSFFGKPVTYLTIGYHAGQDFYSSPVGTVPVIAPCDGVLTALPNLSQSAGWWGFYAFTHNGEVYSLKLLHMYKRMQSGQYKEGDILGYCGATGLSVTQKYDESFIGESHEEQTSDKAVPHLHAELHIGEFKHDTNRIKDLADKRIIDPIKTFEKWVSENLVINNNRMTFYQENGKSSVYIKGDDGTYYPILMEKHFVALFGEWDNNTIKVIENINPKSESYFGLFKSDDNGKYDAT